jgi:hypothetical protein
MKKYIVVTLTMLAPLFAQPPPAHADEADDGAVVSTTYSTSASDVSKGSKSAPASMTASAATLGKCRVITGTVTGKNITNETLWTFTQTAYWCWYSGNITFRYSDFTVTSPFLGWDFKGLVSDSSSAGKPWIRYRQGKFQQCMPIPWSADFCPNSAYPWVRMTMWANGTYSIDHGA